MISKILLISFVLCGICLSFSLSKSAMENYVADNAPAKRLSCSAPGKSYSNGCCGGCGGDCCGGGGSRVRRCEYGESNNFIYSRAILRDYSNSGKVFMYPWDQNERNGDWYHNKGYCQYHDAEMVTIENENESKAFSGFMNNVGITRPGVWLGAQSFNDTSSMYWTGDQSGKKISYTKFGGGVSTKSGLSCLYMGLQLDDDLENPWGTDYCNDKSFLIACQKIVKL